METPNLYLVALIVISLLIFIVLFIKNYQDKKQITTNLLKQKEEVEKQKEQLERLNQEMQAQNQKLQALHQVNNQIFSIISHDLRSPLGSIKGFLRLMQMTELSAQETKYFLNELEGGTNNTLQMLDTLLQWAKNQMNGLQPQFKPVSLNKLIEQVIGNVENQAHLKNITIEAQITSTITLHADEEMLKLVIRNLLTNALKFTPSGGNVYIKAASQDKEVMLQVQDTGIGMSAEQQANLFNPQQTKSTRGTANEKGVGLGLILCKDFIEKHRGNISVSSELKKGTVFTVVLPLAQG